MNTATSDVIITFDGVSEDDSEDDEGDDVGIRQLHQTKDGDEHRLPHQVHDAADALVVAVLLQLPLVPGPAVVVSNG